MLEHLFYAAPAGRDYINHAHFGCAAPLGKITGKFYRMLFFFVGLFQHPVCKTVPTLFLKIEGHLKVKI